MTCCDIHERLRKKFEQIEIKITQLQELKAELLPLIHRCEKQLSQQQIHTDCGVFAEEISLDKS